MKIKKKKSYSFELLLFEKMDIESLISQKLLQLGQLIKDNE